MSPTATTRLLVTAIVVVLLVGAVDAAVSGEWDLFFVIAIAFVLGSALLFRIESRRPQIPIRRDLVVWLRDRASISGEPLSVVTDRAISTFVDRYGVMTDADATRQ